MSCTRRLRPLTDSRAGVYWLALAAAMLCPGTAGGDVAATTVTITLPPLEGAVSTSSSGMAASALPPEVDPVLAERSQRHHLLLLFQRYGDNNGSLSVSGFRRLLHNLGVERVKSIAMEARTSHRAKHHEHSHHQHQQHRHHHHHHRPPDTCAETAGSGRGGRSVTSPTGPANQRAATEANHHGRAEYISGAQLECLNASKLLAYHGIDMQVLLGVTEFGYICPAIINQIDRKSCLIHTFVENKAESNQNVYSVKVAWFGGFISITVISVLSLLGIILVPLMNRVFFKFLLSFLVALAVGTLSGDAFLHLLPHSHSKHYHSHGGSLMETSSHWVDAEDNSDLDATWKGLTALGGLYFMFLVEHLITLVKQYKDKKQKNQKKTENEEDLEISKKLSNHSNNEEKGGSDTGSHHESYMEAEAPDVSQFHAQQPTAPEEEEEEEIMIAHSHDEASYREYVSRGCENKCHSHFHDTLGQSDDLIHHHHDYHHILHHHHHQNHHPHSHSQRYSREELKDAGIATLAWMVIMGDGLHNFSDGLAIGDFAVLLKAGMTVKQAVLYNALSAMLAYLGMITGILIGHYAENISVWIFALTAGLFLYVALVDLVPEMLHNDASDHGCSRWGYFLLQNAGILLGFFIMLVISLFEHKILFSINL
ncbi:hypothetical protein FKM82_006555 [Ascaphus truei]